MIRIGKLTFQEGYNNLDFHQYVKNACFASIFGVKFRKQTYIDLVIPWSWQKKKTLAKTWKHEQHGKFKKLQVVCIARK